LHSIDGEYLGKINLKIKKLIHIIFSEKKKKKKYFFF
jgi:hypothetical protein